MLGGQWARVVACRRQVVQKVMPAALQRSLLRLCWLASLVVAFSAPACAEGVHPWIATWGSAQLQPYGAEVLSPKTFDHTTLREVVHVSAGGSQVRIRLSNVFGQSALEIASVSISRPAAGAERGVIVPESAQKLTFHGATSVSVPMGSEYVSDPISVKLPALSDLVVDIEINAAPMNVTLHTGARATSFLASGSHGGEAKLPSAQSWTRWYFLSGVEVLSGERNAGTVVAFGDSITDGHASTTDGNDRWPDFLARRFAAEAKTHGLGVVNAGIGGNHLLYDGLGPNALARFDRDVLARPGVRYVILLEGINDLGGLDRLEDHGAAVHAAWLAQVESAMAQIVVRSHERGIIVYGATLTPYLGSDYYHPNAASEADRIALNDWIRDSHTFDDVIDFDAVVRNPEKRDHMLPAADSGDHLHPGPEGYRRMGDAIPLKLFVR